MMSAEEEERMIDRSGRSGTSSSGHSDTSQGGGVNKNKHATHSTLTQSHNQYSIEDDSDLNDGTDVVDIDLEETETF